MKLSLVIFSFFLFIIAQAQDCDCSSTFNWLQKTFEENDAGFTYAVESKGQSAYEKHNELFISKVKEISEKEECAATLRDWLSFFRSGHIGFYTTGGRNNMDNNRSPSDSEIMEKYKDWEKLAVDIEAFEAYLETVKEPGIEGIWESKPYKIGIKKEGDTYVGFIIEADGVYWTKEQVKLKIKAEGFSSTFYMRDHSARNFEKAELIGSNHLQMGFINLKRLSPKFDNDPTVQRYLKSISANQPYFDQIDEHTTYLRIPSFSHTEKKAIDKVIAKNLELILSTKNFIIDLRNNGGGSDGSYYELLPILYTNPIRTVGVELLSTPLNNQRMLDFINSTEYDFSEDEKKWAQESYDKLSSRLGEFVNLDSTIVDVTTYDTIHNYPQNIGIIIHENNGSTTEQFLLAAKQSKKVKLFGTTTSGVLDISNMYAVDSPCSDYQLSYSLSRSMRIPDMTIDGKGIQPDYYINKSIAKYEWIEFVHEILKDQ